MNSCCSQEGTISFLFIEVWLMCRITQYSFPSFSFLGSDACFLSLFQQKLIKNSEKQDTLGFVLSDEGDIPAVDFSKHEKRRFHDSKGREIAVFDGLVATADLDALRLFLLHYNSVYQYQGYDGQDEEHDNVSWIAALKVFILTLSLLTFKRKKHIFYH